MHLDRYTCSLLPQELPAFIEKMLPQAEVSISWHGVKVVYFFGYEDGMPITHLAIRYIHAIDWVEEHGSLKERAICDQMLEEIQQLYNRAKTISKSKQIFNLVTTDDDLLFRTLKTTHAKRIFGFPPDTFRSLWPNVDPEEKYTMWTGEQKYVASRALIRQTLEDQNPWHECLAAQIEEGVDSKIQNTYLYPKA